VGKSRTCRASVIRDILRGRLVADPDPHGLRLRGAKITGRLDLENLATGISLELTDCLLEEGISAQNARLAGLVLVGCLLEHATEPALHGRMLVCDGLFLIGTRVIGHSGGGAVNLLGAHVSGTLGCIGGELGNDCGPALYADALQVGQNMSLTDGFTTVGSGEGGAVRLAGARIGGQLVCAGATVGNDSGPALIADSLHVDQGTFLRGFTAAGRGRAGAVRLLGARVGGQFDCAGAAVSNDSGPALSADGLEVGQDMSLAGGFTAVGDGDGGAVRLLGARVGGPLGCAGAELRNDSGPALIADNLQAGQDMSLTDGFTAVGGGSDGAVRLVGARVGGQLSWTGAKVRNDSGPALTADGLHVDQAIYLRGFSAIGCGDGGAVRLLRARVGGPLECAGAQLRNDSGPALYADSLEVGQDISLTDGFIAVGCGSDGAVRLLGARVGGQLRCTGAELRNDSGPALIADSLQAGQDMYLTGDFAATGGGAGVVADLTGARVGGAFLFAPARLEHSADSRRRLAVDGLTYAGVPQPLPVPDWRELLRHGTPGYAAQPYQQLAAGCRALGDERQVRQTLIGQRDDQLARTRQRWPERWWGSITKVTLGYGYQPWRALWFLAGALAVSCVLAVVLGANGALTQTSKTATPGRPCTVIQQLSVGLDLNLPVGASVAREGCDLTADSASVTAAWLSAVSWVLRLLVWAFAALFIAGFTSAVRKT
jgi:hypothetical protein